VLTTSATEITCKVDDTISKIDKPTGTVVVFLKTSEEAVCDISICGGYTFTDIIPTVTAVTSRFDTASASWEVAVQGSGFVGTTSDTHLWVGDSEQVAKSVSASEVVFTVTDV